MANASVEISWVKGAGSVAAQLCGRCLRQQTLAISAGTATLSSAVAASELTDSSGSAIVRISTDDTGCFVAIGIAPDPTLTTATTASTARRWVAAGAELELSINIGDLVAVHG